MQPSFVTPAVPVQARGFGALCGDALRRPGGRRALSVLFVMLMVSGLAMFAYPVATDAYSRYQQGKLNSQFGGERLEQSYAEGKFAEGSVLTRLRIPKLKLDVLVVEGTSATALRAGAGHYVGSPLPGEPGNVAIAGHRTTFGRPFNHLDEMKKGDEVLLETPFKIFHYVVVPPFEGHKNPWPVSPSGTRVLDSIPGKSLLTLTTCHPKGSARQRLILRLELNPALTEDVKQKGA
ncbi:MAG TPA: class E sortase [Mycobacteriales bacterium]|nr:class E sortase [Mycobacteriales bacterium]